MRSSIGHAILDCLSILAGDGGTACRRLGRRYAELLPMMLAAMLSCACAGTLCSATLEVPPAPGDLSSVEHLVQSPDYTVEVRKSGDLAYTTCFVYKTDNYAPTARKSEDSVSFTSVAFSGTAIDVRVTCHFSASSVVVRPLHAGVTPVRAGNVITFSLSEPRKLSIEVNDRKNPLFLFTQAPDVPNLGATYYYAPGTVTNIGLQKQLKSGESVYIAAGAVVEGSFKLDWNSSNISIKGRGILSMGQWPWESTDLAFLGPKAMISGASHNLQMEGITLANSTGWQIPIYNSDGNKVYNNQLRNLKLISWNPNSDGIWVNGDNHIVDDCFIFNNDDACMSHAVSNSRISNMVIWGGPWGRIYMHSQQDTKPLSSNLIMENIDVIGKDSGKELILMDGSAGYAQTIRDFTFRNFRIEEHPQGAGIWAANRFINLNTSGTKTIQNLLFENIDIAYKNTDEGDLYGTASSPIDGITFRNLRMAGTPITSLAAGNMDKNAYVTHVVFELTPEMDVRQGAVPIADGSGSAAFGEVAVGASATRTFTIDNSGCGPLTLSGSPRVVVSGAGYALVGDAASVIAGGGSSTFQVSFAPLTASSHAGAVSIANDDADEHPYTFSLSGLGTVAVKTAQVISFGALPPKELGDADFAGGATASSGLAVSYASSDTAVATIVGGLIHIVGPGTTTITASQSGNAVYDPAPSVSQVLTVGAALGLPQASITASLPSASEAGPVHGRFTVTLSPAPAAPVTVAYAVAAASTATAGGDYAALGGSVVVGAGGSADIPVTVLADSLFEGPQTVTLDLLPGSGYQVAGAQTATVSIADDDALQVSGLVLHPDPPLAGQAVTAQVLSNAEDSATLQVQWTWGDGGSEAGGAFASHTYAGAGGAVLAVSVSSTLGGGSIAYQTAVTVASAGGGGGGSGSLAAGGGASGGGCGLGGGLAGLGLAILACAGAVAARLAHLAFGQPGGHGQGAFAGR